MDNEPISVDPREGLKLNPVLPAGTMRDALKTWPDEEEKHEIALLKGFLWFSAIASWLIGVILFALVNRSWL